jgi:hypothetical protein
MPDVTFQAKSHQGVSVQIKQNGEASSWVNTAIAGWLWTR